METLPETKIRETGRLGANATAGEVTPHAVDDHPEQPVSDLSPASENAETTGAPVPLPETEIRNTGQIGADAAAVNIILRSSNDDPDKVASDLRLGQKYAEATGGPVPPQSLLKENRDLFRQKTEEAENNAILSQSPVFLGWMRVPKNAYLARDDVPTLAYFERIGRPTTTPMAADGSGGATLPATPPNASTQAAPKKTDQEVLAEEVAGAKDIGKEEIAALEDRIAQQRRPDRDLWQSVLQNVRKGNFTREQALAVLNPTAPRVALEVAEAVKAVPGGAVGSVGKAVEGTGQMLYSVTSDSDSRNALAAAIIGIYGKTISREQEKELRDQIWAQGEINPNIAQSVVSDLLAGDETAEGAAARLEAPLKVLAMDLQAGGAWTQDYGAHLFPARPGMENSPGRKFGEAVGSMVPLVAITAASGGSAAVAYNLAQNAGDATSGARKAGKDEHTQTIAAYSGLLPGALGSFPLSRLIPAPAAKAGAAAFLKYLGLQAVVSATQNAGQQAFQNAIAKYLYAPEKSLAEGVAANFSAGAFVTAMELAVRAMIKGAKLSGSPGSRLPDGGAGKTQVTVAEISKNAQQSKLRQRDPERFHQLVDQLTANGPAGDIYVPSDQFVDYLTKRGLDLDTEVDRLGWTSRSDLDAAIAAGGDLKISTATYAAKIAGSEHDAFFKENGRLNPDDMSARQAAELKRREEEAQKDAEDARIDRQARDAVEGTEKDAETARVNRETRRFVKEATGNGEAVDVGEQARRAVEGVDKGAEPAPVIGKTGRIAKKASGDAKAVDVDEQARRAVEGVEKDAETARINRKTGRIARKAP